ncbi:MAG: Ig-like domain-containing protein [Clostridiales bacterium]
MRNLKRSLAILVVFALVITMIIPALAQSYTYSDEFDKLHDLGLISGTGTDEDGKPIASLDMELTRETGAAMLVKLWVGQAKIDELEATLDNDTVLAAAEEIIEDQFSDADDVSEWAIPYLAYAVENEMIEGRTDGTFAPQGNLSGRDFATMFLRQLGYEISGEEWETACYTLEEKGGLTEIEADDFNEKSLTRDEMVGIAFGTLSAENSDGERLINFLVESGVVDETKAMTAGFVTKTIKSVATQADIPVEIGGSYTLTETVEVTFEDDSKANVGVMWDDSDVDTSKEGTYEVKGTIDSYADGTMVNVIVQPATFEILSATSTNLKEIDITFNRALDKTTAETTSYYTGGISTPTSATLQADGKTVRLLSSTTLTAYQTYSIVVSNVKDINGNVITTQTKEVTASDTAIPQIEKVEGKGNKKIEVTFTEPVQNITTALRDNFIVDSTALSSMGAISLGADLRKVTITLTNPLLPGTHKLTLAQSQGTGNEVKDYAGYTAVVSANEFTVENDTTIPQVTGAVPSSQTLLDVTFDEEMNTLTNTNVFWNTSGSETDTSRTCDTITDTDGDNTWSAVFNTNYMTAGKVYVFVQNETDLNGNKMAGNYKPGVYRAEVTVTANTVPTITSVTPISDKQIDIIFSDSVDETTSETNSNYTIKDSTGTTYTATATLDTVVTSSTYKKKLSLTFSTALAGGTYTVDTTTGIKDVVGNYLVASSNTIAITDTTQPSSSVATAEYKGQSVVLTFSENMMSSGTNSALDVSNYKWIDGAAAVADLPAGTTITKITDAKYRITFPTTTTVSNNDDIVVGYFSGSSLKTVADSSGNLYTPGNIDIGTAKGAVDLSSVTGAKLNVTGTNTLVFTLPTDQSTLSTVLASEFEITKDNGTNWFKPATATLSTDGKTVTFTVADANKFVASDMASVDLKVLQTGATGLTSGTKDVFDSTITAPVTTTVVTSNNISPALLTFAVAGSNTIYVKTDGIMEDDYDNSGAADDADGTVTGNQDAYMKTSLKIEQGGVNKAINYVTRDNDLKQFVVTLTDAIDPAVDVTVKTLGADFISAKGANGALLAANTTGITLNSLAAYKTTVTQAGVNPAAAGDTIAIKFNRNVATTSIKSLWDGTATSNSVAVTYDDNTAGDTLTIAGVGTFTGISVTADASSTSDSTMLYDASSSTLTITLGATAANSDLNDGNIMFTPNSNIKTTSGTAINTTFVAID